MVVGGGGVQSRPPPSGCPLQNTPPFAVSLMIPEIIEAVQGVLKKTTVT